MEETFLIDVPEEANLQLPAPELVSYYKSLEDREYWLDEEIDSGSLDLVKYILQWNKEDKGIAPQDRKPIKIYFNSLGGMLDIAYTLYDIIRLSKTPVIGINIGYCASAAAYIFIACHQRKMSKHSYFIFHQGSINGLNGGYKQIMASIQDYQSQVEELSALIRERTLYTEEEISKNIINEWYIHYEEALEKGVVQTVINNIEDVLGEE